MPPRIQPLDPKKTSGPAREIFDAVTAKIGMIPNLYRVLGHSPVALAAYLALNERLTAARLGPALREKVALAVSQRNGCGHCLSDEGLELQHLYRAERLPLRTEERQDETDDGLLAREHVHLGRLPIAKDPRQGLSGDGRTGSQVVRLVDQRALAIEQPEPEHPFVAAMRSTSSRASSSCRSRR